MNHYKWFLYTDRVPKPCLRLNRLALDVFVFEKRHVFSQKGKFFYKPIHCVLRLCDYAYFRKHEIDAKRKDIQMAAGFCFELSCIPDWWPKQCSRFARICQSLCIYVYRVYLVYLVPYLSVPTHLGIISNCTYIYIYIHV